MHHNFLILWIKREVGVPGVQEGRDTCMPMANSC